jgi:hypothetical protein
MGATRYAMAARLFGVCLWLALGIGLFVGGGRFNALSGDPFSEDLIVFHAVGTACRTGHCADMYDVDEQARLQRASFGPGSHAMPYVLPPHTALLFAPGSWLSFPLLAAVWAALSLGALAVALRLLRAGGTSLLVVFGFYPVFDAFCAGQTVFLSLLLFAAAARAWDDERPFLAGLAAGAIAAWKPHFLVGVGLLWLLEARRDPRPLLGLLTAVAALVAVDLAFLWPQTRAYAAWTARVLGGGEPFWASLQPGGELTLKEFFSMLLPMSTHLAALLAAAAALAGVVLYVWFWSRHRERRLLAFAGAVLLTLWVAPHAHLHDWTLLVLPGAILWRELPDARPRLLPVYALMYAVSAVVLRVARFEWAAFGWAFHPAIPVLAFSVFASLSSTLRRAASTRRPDSGPHAAR